MNILGYGGPVAGGPANSPHLPWSVYTYGHDGFAWECPKGHNLNVMGYRFLRAHKL